MVNFFAFLCRLLMTFANGLDPDQARQKVGPNLDPNGSTLMVFIKYFLPKMFVLKKVSRRQKHAKLPSRQRIVLNSPLFQHTENAFILCREKFDRQIINLLFRQQIGLTLFLLGNFACLFLVC